ncbi:hypothetical protein VP01_1596g1 [Puccinia sorghi]|uniref:Uncharacterized protein n=1 Tax=Puccinia sorghi TaxID=27349 RepID=A0A0L6VJ94_9BASI|nr:hypothetical protein VP01_1596g1 [Puccinia sorghi]
MGGGEEEGESGLGGSRRRERGESAGSMEVDGWIGWLMLMMLEGDGGCCFGREGQLLRREREETQRGVVNGWIIKAGRCFKKSFWLLFLYINIKNRYKILYSEKSARVRVSCVWLVCIQKETVHNTVSSHSPTCAGYQEKKKKIKLNKAIHELLILKPSSGKFNQGLLRLWLETPAIWCLLTQLTLYAASAKVRKSARLNQRALMVVVSVFAVVTFPIISNSRSLLSLRTHTHTSNTPHSYITPSAANLKVVIRIGISCKRLDERQRRKLSSPSCVCVLTNSVGCCYSYSGIHTQTDQDAASYKTISSSMNGWETDHQVSQNTWLLFFFFLFFFFNLMRVSRSCGERTSPRPDYHASYIAMCNSNQYLAPTSRVQTISVLHRDCDKPSNKPNGENNPPPRENKDEGLLPLRIAFLHNLYGLIIYNCKLRAQDVLSGGGETFHLASFSPYPQRDPEHTSQLRSSIIHSVCGSNASVAPTEKKKKKKKKKLFIYFGPAGRETSHDQIHLELDLRLQLLMGWLRDVIISCNQVVTDSNIKPSRRSQLLPKHPNRSKLARGIIYLFHMLSILQLAAGFLYRVFHAECWFQAGSVPFFFVLEGETTKKEMLYTRVNRRPSDRSTGMVATLSVSPILLLSPAKLGAKKKTKKSPFFTVLYITTNAAVFTNHHRNSTNGHTSTSRGISSTRRDGALGAGPLVGVQLRVLLIDSSGERPRPRRHGG